MYIYGEKIVLRALENEDNEMLLNLINDPKTEELLGGSSWPVSESDQRKWLERQEINASTLRCIIAIKEDLKNAIGTVILGEIDQKNGTGHIHIKMKQGNVRGKGYGTDAVKTMVKYAFDELRLHCVYANIISYNDVSVRLFERCGFQREGVLRDRIYKGGRYVDELSYSIINQ
jgi:RimJ/RimL family protein N-acetyltransferase